MKKGNKLYLILQTLVCIALAATLALAAVSIYREGAARKALDPMQSVYTPGIVAGKLAPILPLAVAALCLLVAGLVLGLRDARADRPVRDAEWARDLAVRRVNRPSGDMLRQRAAGKRLQWIGWGAFALGMVPVALFLANPANFPADDPEAMFLGLLRALLPGLAVGLGALSVTAVLRERSALRETEAAAAQIRAERAEGLSAPPAPPAPMRRKGAVQAVLVVAAVALIVAGVLNGSARDVLYKAITICTECVGLG